MTAARRLPQQPAGRFVRGFGLHTLIALIVNCMVGAGVLGLPAPSMRWPATGSIWCSRLPRSWPQASRCALRGSDRVIELPPSEWSIDYG